jgi:hypothetical protein
MSTSPLVSAPLPTLTLAQLLAEQPVGTLARVTDLTDPATQRAVGTGPMPRRERRLCRPTLTLHCDSPACQKAPTIFDPVGSVAPVLALDASHERAAPHVLEYGCRHCLEKVRTYVLKIVSSETDGGVAAKLGEWSESRPMYSNRLLALFDDVATRDLFLKGLQAERQGLGIAAHAYYRRVVEASAARIFERCIAIEKDAGASPELLETLRLAGEGFALDVPWTPLSLPASLSVEGRDPFDLLHRALSVSSRRKSDDECLQAAHVARVMLVKLAGTLDDVVEGQAELRDALDRLTSEGGPPSEAVDVTA